LREARDQFWDPSKGNPEIYSALLEKIHAALPSIFGFRFKDPDRAKELLIDLHILGEIDERQAVVAGIGNLSVASIVPAVLFGPLGWGYAAVVGAGNAGSKILLDWNRWTLLLRTASCLMLMHEWCAWTGMEEITTETFQRAYVVVHRVVPDLLRWLRRNFDMLDAAFRLNIKNTITQILEEFGYDPSRPPFSGINRCRCSFCK
jgi:hypothetical protein